MATFNKNILQTIKDKEALFQQNALSKLENGEHLTDEEMLCYQLTDEDTEVLGIFKKVLDGEFVPGFELKDFLASPQAKVLIPRVVIGAMRTTQEAQYLASAMYKKVRMKSGNAMIFPSIGVIRAHQIAEGQEIPSENLAWQKHKNSFISASKKGVRLQFTDTLINECEFDIVKIMIQEAGRALGRLKEELAFAEWLTHGHTVFNNELRRADPIKYAHAGTTGVDFNNNLNDTIAIDDILDMIINLYNNGYNCTDLILHPLSWVTFAKTGLTGALTALTDRNTTVEKPGASFKIGSKSMQGRIPFDFNVNLSPFCPLDRENFTYDMFACDRNNVGVQLVKSDLKTEEFNDPSRDIKNMKFTEEYSFATYNEGRAISSAKNISMARSWPTPERTIVLNNK